MPRECLDLRRGRIADRNRQRSVDDARQLLQDLQMLHARHHHAIGAGGEIGFGPLDRRLERRMHLRAEQKGFRADGDHGGHLGFGGRSLHRAHAFGHRLDRQDGVSAIASAIAERDADAASRDRRADRIFDLLQRTSARAFQIRVDRRVEAFGDPRRDAEQIVGRHPFLRRVTITPADRRSGGADEFEAGIGHDARSRNVPYFRHDEGFGGLQTPAEPTNFVLLAARRDLIHE